MRDDRVRVRHPQPRVRGAVEIRRRQAGHRRADRAQEIVLDVTPGQEPVHHADDLGRIEVAPDGDADEGGCRTMKSQVNRQVRRNRGRLVFRNQITSRLLRRRYWTSPISSS